MFFYYLLTCQVRIGRRKSHILRQLLTQFNLFLDIQLYILQILSKSVLMVIAPVPPLPQPSYTYCHRPNFTIDIGTKNSTDRIMGDFLLPVEDVRRLGTVSTKADLAILSPPSTQLPWIHPTHRYSIVAELEFLHVQHFNQTNVVEELGVKSLTW